MPLETGTYISDLNASNPAATDEVSKADDHLRLIKQLIKATFANVSNVVNATHTQLNNLASLAALSILGNGTNGAAAPTALTAANDNEVLRRSGTAVAFGKVALGGLADRAQNTVIGRISSGTGTPEELTAANLRTIIGTASESAEGVAEQATDAEVQAGADDVRFITPAGLVAKEASAAQYRANTADRLLTTDVAWAAAEEVALTDAATIAVDMSTFINASVTLGGNRTLGQPTSTKNGQTGCIRITQDGTGSRTLAFHADWKFANGTDPTLSTAAGATDLLFYQVIQGWGVYASLAKAVA